MQETMQIHINENMGLDNYFYSAAARKRTYYRHKNEECKERNRTLFSADLEANPVKSTRENTKSILFKLFLYKSLL